MHIHEPMKTLASYELLHYTTKMVPLAGFKQVTNKNLLKITVSTTVTCLVAKFCEKVQFTEETVKRPAS